MIFIIIAVMCGWYIVVHDTFLVALAVSLIGFAALVHLIVLK